jgi:nucleoid-associated protein YgaU
MLCLGTFLLVGGCLFSSPNPVTERISRAPATLPICQTNRSQGALAEDSSLRLQEMQQRIVELTEMLAAAANQPYDKRPDVGLVQTVEKKAKWGDALAAELNALNARTEAMRNELSESQKAIAVMGASINYLHARTNELAQSLTDISDKLTPIEANMRMLRLGNYEYYTVRPGDTCKSIAAQPFVYGDETKHILIRQSNREQVADLDHLVPDTVLIIPRPAATAVHEL